MGEGMAEPPRVAEMSGGRAIVKKDLKNIGPKTLKRLESIGVYTLEDIETLGVIKVYLRLKAVYPQEVSLNALWALQGAVLDIPWNQLLPELKTALKTALEKELADAGHSA